MRGTTANTANHFKNVAGKSRPATKGNKNTNARASRKSTASQLASSRTVPIKGPDRGEG